MEYFLAFFLILLVLITYNTGIFLQGTLSSPHKCQLTPRWDFGTWEVRSCSTSPFHLQTLEHHLTWGHSRWLASQTSCSFASQSQLPASFSPPSIKTPAEWRQVFKTRVTSVLRPESSSAQGHEPHSGENWRQVSSASVIPSAIYLLEKGNHCTVLLENGNWSWGECWSQQATHWVCLLKKSPLEEHQLVIVIV